MIKLDLRTENETEKRILDYLQENADEILAEKINKGVQVQKDGLTLVNMKAIPDFMEYAHKQAQELAQKGARFAMVDDNVVFGWAIHYFGEDEIIGVLYNLDGTEYKPAKKEIAPKPQKQTTIPVKPTARKTQDVERLSLFDLIDGQTEEQQEVEETEIEPDNNDAIQEKPMVIEQPVNQVVEPPTEKKGSPLYQKYMEYQDEYPDAIIAMRLGDFYEVFGDPAAMISEELDLTLTGRDCGLDKRAPMVGFPYHVADNYFEKITNNHDLLIVESDNVVRAIQKKNTQPKIENKNDELLDVLSKIFGSSLEVIQ